jgi:hypothetical protein
MYFVYLYFNKGKYKVLSMHRDTNMFLISLVDSCKREIILVLSLVLSFTDLDFRTAMEQT